MVKTSNEWHWSPAAAAGLGWALPNALADSGFDLAINGVRDDVASGRRRSKRSRKRGATVHYCRGDVASAADRQAIIDAVHEPLRPARCAREQRRRRPDRAGRHSRCHRRKLRPRDRHQSQGPVLSHAARRPLDDRTAQGRRRLSRRDRQRLVGERDRSLDQPRRLLHQQGRHRDGHATLGPPAGRVRHRRLRSPARHHPHRHERRRWKKSTTG